MTATEVVGSILRFVEEELIPSPSPPLSTKTLLTGHHHRHHPHHQDSADWPASPSLTNVQVCLQFLTITKDTAQHVRGVGTKLLIVYTAYIAYTSLHCFPIYTGGKTTTP